MKYSYLGSDGDDQIEHHHCRGDQIEHLVPLGTPSHTSITQKTQKISKITNEDISNEIKFF